MENNFETDLEKEMSIVIDKLLQKDLEDYFKYTTNISFTPIGIFYEGGEISSDDVNNIVNSRKAIDTLYKNRNSVYNKAIEKFGKSGQFDMAQEEATELALAIRRYNRLGHDAGIDNLLEEIADTEIMIEQLKLMLPLCSVYKIKDIKKSKINRLNNIL